MNQLSQSVRALILPVDGTRPYHVDVELHGVVDSTGSVRWDPHLDPLLGHSSTSSNSIVTRGVGERVLRFPLHIFFQVSPDAMTDTNEVARNACVEALTGGTPHPWKGDIIVLRFSGARRRGYSNIEQSDTTSIIHFLFRYGR